MLRHRWTTAKLLLILSVILVGSLAIGPASAAMLDAAEAASSRSSSPPPGMLVLSLRHRALDLQAAQVPAEPPEATAGDEFAVPAASTY